MALGPQNFRGRLDKIKTLEELIDMAIRTSDSMLVISIREYDLPYIEQ